MVSLHWLGPKALQAQICSREETHAEEWGKHNSSVSAKANTQVQIKDGQHKALCYGIEACLKLLGSRAHLELIGGARLKVTKLAAEVNVSCRVVDLLPAGADIPNRQPAGPHRRPLSVPRHARNARSGKGHITLQSGPSAWRKPHEAHGAAGCQALLPCTS